MPIEKQIEIQCYSCGAILDTQYDYSCVSCGRQTCDNHNEVCQEFGEDSEGECDLVTCSLCLEVHTLTRHDKRMGSA
jgi:DNA-directed RNA polymerase subunit N (RpoN/RPB10)